VKHTFKLIYELDTTVACAVAAYLDAEHYVFLHKTYLPEYEAIEHDGNRIKIRQAWTFAGIKVDQECWTEYQAPARFMNYEISSSPWWIPTIHHVMKTKTDLRYYPTKDGKRTVSDLTVELDMPLALWPFRKLIEKKLCALKWEKDKEDIEMVERRAKIFGRGNVRSYWADHQFMLHKEAFMEHFGPEATKGAPGGDAANDSEPAAAE
jgi:hypothetical protein